MATEEKKIPDQKEKIEFFYESRFYEIGKRIASFDSLKVDVQNLDSALRDALIKLNSISQDHVLEKEELNKKLDALGKTLAWLQSKLEASDAKCSSGDAYLDKRVVDLENFRQNHYNLEAKHNDSEKKLSFVSAAHDDLRSSLKQLSFDLDKSRRMIEESVGAISQLKGSLVSHQGDLDSLRRLHESLSYSVQGLEKSILILKDEFKHALESLASTFELSLSDMSKAFEKKIAGIFIPDVSGFAKKADVDKVSNDARISSLDAKNAFMKANNLENQLLLMGKKIESLLIQMKTYEIEKSQNEG